MKGTYSKIKDERGLSFIITCLGIIAVFGMGALVTDFGRIALAHQRLANAADSAAMAAAQDLALATDKDLGAITAGRRVLEVAGANGVDSENVTVSIDGNKISVDIQQEVGLIMSRIFGVNEKTVSAHAAAAAGSNISYTGIAPLTIHEQPLTYGQLVTLKYGSPKDAGQFRSMGNFGALALGGRGAKNYRDKLINGYQEEVHIGDKLETEPGNMNGPTDGIDVRLSRCTDGCTFDNFKPGCPRVIVIPTHNEDSLHGRDEITVTGFAAFFVDRDSTNCASDEIKGYFVRMVAEGDPDFSKPVTSLYGVRLVE
ncbi:MAG: pilus assembly protein TadG-related protein [Bacillota bacterium]